MECICDDRKEFLASNGNSAFSGPIGYLRGVRFRSMRVLRIPCQNTFQDEVVSLRSFHLAGARCCFLG